MTTQQAGREAFEAWAREHGYELDRSVLPGYYWANDTQDQWEVWQAALEQQDFPSRFFANGPQGSAWFDDLSLASDMVEAFDKDDDWTITDTQDMPAPKQQVVDEAMVDRALAAYNASRGTYSDEVPTDRDDIRAALLAALPGKTEAAP